MKPPLRRTSLSLATPVVLHQRRILIRVDRTGVDISLASRQGATFLRISSSRQQTQWSSATADDQKNRGPADRTRINVNEPYELAYWTKEIGVSEKTLRDAVAKVGVMAPAVRAHLK